MGEIRFNETRPYSNSPFWRFLNRIWNSQELLFGTGAFKLPALHQHLVDALLGQMEPALAQVIRRQLDEPFFIQFWGRVSCIFFEDFNLPIELRIQDSEFLDSLYRVEMFVDGKKQWAQVTFYNGRIHSFELRKPLKFYRDKQVAFGKAMLGNPKQSITRAIDRQEHGSGEV